MDLIENSPEIVRTIFFLVGWVGTSLLIYALFFSAWIGLKHLKQMILERKRISHGRPKRPDCFCADCNYNSEGDCVYYGREIDGDQGFCNHAERKNMAYTHTNF